MSLPQTLSQVLPQIVWTGIALGGIAGSALCSGAESAMYGVDRLRVEAAAAEDARAGRRKSRARALGRELAHPDRLLATLLIGNNACNYLGVLGVAGLLQSFGLGETMQIVVNVLVVTPVLLVFAESLPKELFRLAADRASYRVMPIVRLMRWALTLCLVLPVVLAFSRGVGRLFGSSSSMADPRARLSGLLIDAAGTGSITPRQATMIDSAMSLGTVRVADVMHAWDEIEKVRANDPRHALVDAMASVAGQSLLCIPVVDDGQSSVSAANVARGSGGSRGRGRGGGGVRGVFWKADVLASGHDDLCVRACAHLTKEMGVVAAAELVAQSDARAGVVFASGVPVGLVTLKDLVAPLLRAST